MELLRRVLALPERLKIGFHAKQYKTFCLQAKQYGTFCRQAKQYRTFCLQDKQYRTFYAQLRFSRGLKEPPEHQGAQKSRTLWPLQVPIWGFLCAKSPVLFGLSTKSPVLPGLNAKSHVLFAPKPGRPSKADRTPRILENVGLRLPFKTPFKKC